MGRRGVGTYVYRGRVVEIERDKGLEVQSGKGCRFRCLEWQSCRG